MKRILLFATFIFSISIFVLGNQAGTLVTAGKAGPFKVGMTVGEAKAVSPDYKYSRTSDGEGIALVAVEKAGKLIFTFYAGEEDPDAALDEKAVIEHIQVWDSAFKTKEGVGPGTPIKDAEATYGKVKEIMLSEIEAREYIEFMNSPKAITMRIEGAGIFEGSSRKTTKYRSGAKIRSLIINGDGTETNVGFYSSYTDLEKDCKTPKGQGADGGHVSTYCEGPENYRVHMYDSAKYLEITVKSTNSRKDISVTRQALDFDLKGRKLEWRYKNGYPFAVILRGNTYKNGEDGLIKYPKEITGEYLFVRGLPGFEAINADVNLRTTKFANEEARKIASEGYVKVKFPSVFEIDAGDYNEMILLAARKGEAWVKSAMGVVMKLAGEFEDTKNRKILLEAPFADGYDEFTMTLVNDGLADDSVRTQKTVFKIKKNSDGIWMVKSAQRSWRCWEGRGHQDFGAVMCS